MPIPLAAALPAAASLISSGLNAFSAESTNKAMRRHNIYMYDRQRADALADFAMQNEYNSPTSQMARLKNAGLNPNLVYGNGSATESSAPIRSSDSKSWNPQAPQIDLTGVGNSLANYVDLKMKEQQIDNLKAQKTVADEEAILKRSQASQTDIQTANIAQQTATSKFQLEQANRLKDISFETHEQQLRQIKQNIDKTQADTKYTLDNNERAAALTSSSLMEAKERILMMRIQASKNPHEISLLKAQLEGIKYDSGLKHEDLELKRNGLQPHDPTWQRVLIQNMGYRAPETRKVSNSGYRFGAWKSVDKAAKRFKR